MRDFTGRIIFRFCVHIERKYCGSGLNCQIVRLKYRLGSLFRVFTIMSYGREFKNFLVLLQLCAFGDSGGINEFEIKSRDE